MLIGQLALAIGFTAIVTGGSHSYAQTIYRCVGSNGRVELRDTPCAGTERQDVARQEITPVDDIGPRIRTFDDKNRVELDACRSKYTRRCADLEAQLENLRNLQRLRKELRDIQSSIKDNDGALKLSVAVATTNARIAHRVASEDYERLDRQLRGSYSSGNFDALLAARSEAHTRKSKANRDHYEVTRRWLE